MMEEVKSNSTPPQISQKSYVLIGIGFVVLITILGSVMPASWFGIEIKDKPKNLINIEEIASLAKDSNNDNNPDWRDFLITKLNGNPEINNVILNTNTSADIDKDLSDPNNLTASFAKNIYTASAYINQTNNIATESQESLVNNIIDAESKKIYSKEYTYDDLNILQKESTDIIKSYGNEVGAIINNLIDDKYIKNELYSFSNFIETKDPSHLKSINLSRERIVSSIDSLLNVKVPISASSYHILALNRLKDYKDILDGMSKGDTDPLRASLSFKEYLNSVILVGRINGQFSSYFSSKKITFSTKDAGYIFSPSYTNKK